MQFLDKTIKIIWNQLRSRVIFSKTSREKNSFCNHVESPPAGLYKGCSIKALQHWTEPQALGNDYISLPIKIEKLASIVYWKFLYGPYETQ